MTRLLQVRLFLLACLVPFASSSKICSSVSFSVTAKAENTRFADPPDPDNSTTILDWLAAQGGPNGPATNGTISIKNTNRNEKTKNRPVSLKAINVLQL